MHICAKHEGPPSSVVAMHSRTSCSVQPSGLDIGAVLLAAVRCSSGAPKAIKVPKAIIAKSLIVRWVLCGTWRGRKLFANGVFEAVLKRRMVGANESRNRQRDVLLYDVVPICDNDDVYI